MVRTADMCLSCVTGTLTHSCGLPASNTDIAVSPKSGRPSSPDPVDLKRKLESAGCVHPLVLLLDCHHHLPAHGGSSSDRRYRHIRRFQRHQKRALSRDHAHHQHAGTERLRVRSPTRRSPPGSPTAALRTKSPSPKNRSGSPTTGEDKSALELNGYRVQDLVVDLESRGVHRLNLASRQPPKSTTR